MSLPLVFNFTPLLPVKYHASLSPFFFSLSFFSLFHPQKSFTDKHFWIHALHFLSFAMSLQTYLSVTGIKCLSEEKKSPISSFSLALIQSSLGRVWLWVTSHTFLACTMAAAGLSEQWSKQENNGHFYQGSRKRGYSWRRGVWGKKGKLGKGWKEEEKRKRKRRL